MTDRFLELLFTDAVKARQIEHGSRDRYARIVARGDGTDDMLGEAEAEFIAASDSFYMASVGADGWPYVQHRGGPPGFLKILDPSSIGFADFRGNLQYISVGNFDGDDRVSLFLMDYPRRRRLKILGRARAEVEPAIAARLTDAGYGAPGERAIVVRIEALSWNCPRHLTPRFTEAEIGPTIDKLTARIGELEQLLAQLTETGAATI